MAVMHNSPGRHAQSQAECVHNSAGTHAQRPAVSMHFPGGVRKQLKAQDQMAWVGAMNSIRNQAEEIINAEIIYT